MTDQERPVEGLRESKPQGRGCFFWGCLTALALLVCIGGCVGFVGYKAYQLAMQITSPDARPVPQYEAKPGEAQAVQARLEEFKQAAKNDQPSELVLTADDLNALIAQSPQFKDLRGKAFVRIEDDLIALDLSIPIPEDIPFVGGRYFNGTGSGKLGVLGGRLVLFLESASVDGQPIPPEAMKQFREKNLLEGAPDHPELGEFVRAVKSLEVQDGKVILKR